MMANALRIAGRYYSIPLLLVVWQAAVASGLIESRLLPSVGRVFVALDHDIGDGVLPYHTAITLSRAGLGFALAAIVGVPFAAAMARSTLVRNLFEPIFFFGYPVPKIALFPIFTYIFGIGSPSKVAFAFLECLYPIVVTAYLGFRAIPLPLIWTAENMGARRATLLRRVVLPAALPTIFTGLRIALPISIIVIVLTEMIGDFSRPRLLHLCLRHALRICRCVCRHPGNWCLRFRARPYHAVAAPRRAALGARRVRRSVVNAYVPPCMDSPYQRHDYATRPPLDSVVGSKLIFPGLALAFGRNSITSDTI